ncbi:uncharacterized protein DS421_15g505980 [Arachis hypogaea]|nr:uncharacterized protein DS421_15g505980 [Arachis hypogaea]
MEPHLRQRLPQTLGQTLAKKHAREDPRLAQSLTSNFGSNVDDSKGRLADMKNLSQSLPQTLIQALMVHGPVHKWVSLQLQEQSTEAIFNPIPSRPKAQLTSLKGTRNNLIRNFIFFVICFQFHFHLSCL